MSQPPSSAGSLVGRRLGKYELLALLALGGTAEIYLARIGGVAGFEKYVVVKCLHDDLADDAEFVRMFLDEARLGAQLEHSNIVQTLELGEQNRRYYLVMEYLAGMSLSLIARKSAERVPGGLMPVELTLGLLAQACSGLHYAHQRTGSNGQLLGIVHRDVSPQNLVVSFEGMLKVVDFGIAKALERETRTQSGTIKGKFAYMSPEQCRAGQVDHRTDIFALGIILHELLTGQRLFKRESPYHTYHAILAGKVPAPSTLNPMLDPALDALVLKALAPEADNRYATAEAFGDALTRMLHGRGHAVSPGVMSQFFDRYFSKEIDEHGQRMRELIEGRMAASVDEQWDDEAKSDVAMAASSSGEPKPIAPMLLDGSASEPSVLDSELLEEVEEDEVVEGQDDYDDGGATRIELNPLEDAKLLHEHVTGQIMLPEASRHAATPVPPERASAHTPAGLRPASAEMPAMGIRGTRQPTSAPASHGRPLADLPSPVEAVQRRSARAMSISSGVPRLSTAAHSSASMARTFYPPAADGPAAADPPDQGSQKRPPSGRFGPVAMLDTQPGELLQERLGSGKFPSPDNLRTQIADPAAQPAGQAPSQPAEPTPSQPADEARFPASANLRTQIADPSADAPANVSADSASMPIPRPSAAEAHALPEHLVQSGPVPVTLPDGASPRAQATYAAGPNVDGIPDMPAVARPMNTSTHMALTGGARQKKPKMPQWLLAVIFVAAVGLSLGITVLLSKLL